MGKLIRCISEDGTLTVMAADTTDIVTGRRRFTAHPPLFRRLSAGC